MGSRKALKHIAQACAALSVGIAALALAGWALDWLVLARGRATYVPMAPSTALAVLLLGSAILAVTREELPRWRRIACLGSASLAAILVGIILVQWALGSDFGVERWLAPTGATLEGIPLGRMSPMTAVSLLVASVALLVLLAVPTGQRTSAHDVAAGLAAGVAALGLLVILGYAYGAPLLYGGTEIPVALPTAWAIVLLGASLLFLAGSSAQMLRGHFAAVLALGVGGLASVVVFALVQGLEETRVRGEFERHASLLAARLQRSINRELQALEGIEALLVTDEEVTRLEFQVFAGRILTRHRSLQALAWNPRLSGEQRAEYEAAARRDGLRDFRITERNSLNEISTAGRRSEYIITFYIEPSAGNRRLLGLDATSDPVQSAALERARDSGQMAAAGARIPLTETSGTESGVVVFQPIYRPGASPGSARERRSNIWGFVVGFYRIGVLVEEALQGVERGGIGFSLSEETPTAGSDVLFASPGERPAGQSGRPWVTSIDMADRRWVLEIYPTPQFLAAHRTGQAWGLFGSGLVLTILAGGYLFSSARRTAAVVKAQQDLRRRTQQLDAVRGVSHEITRELDLQTVLDLITRRAAELAGAVSGAVYMWDEDEQILKPRTWHGHDDWMKDVRLKLSEGITGTVAQHRQGMIVNDYPNSPYAISPFVDRGQITATLAEPLLHGDRLVGVITINNAGTGRPFTEQDRESLELFAAQAAIAIENARLHDATVQRAQHLSTLNDLMQRLATALRPEAVGHEILTAVELLIPSAVGRLWEQVGDTGSLQLVASLGLRDAKGGARQLLPLGEGLAGIAATTREPAMSPAVTRDPRFINQAWASAEGLVSCIVLPLLHGESVQGVLAIFTRKEHTFTDEEVVFLRSFASQASIALRTARHFSAAEQRAAELNELREIGQAITSRLELSEVLEGVVAGAIRLLDNPFAQLILWDEATQRLRYGAALGLEAERARQDSYELDKGAIGTVAQTRQPLILQEYQAWPRANPAYPDIVATITTPIVFGDRLLGILHSHTTEPGKHFSPDDLRRLQMLATQAAIAIENARLHQAVRHQATELEARVKERTAELEEALRVKSQFLATMSHELRTPLNSIIGFSEILREQRAGPLTERQIRYLGNIHQSGAHLLDLVNNILDLSLVEEGEKGLQPEQIDLAPLVQEVMGLFSLQAAQRRLRVSSEIKPGVSIVADRRKLLQILNNLVGNAVKFTPDGGSIAISARDVVKEGTGAEEEGGGAEAPGAALPSGASAPRQYVEIVVEDTGIGIALRDLDRIFGGFEQGDSSFTRRYGGAGIGLTLVRTLVELHGGRIWAESGGTGKGARFVVRLPLIQAVQRKRLVVVDDEPNLLASLSMFLERAGYEVEGAASGAEGLTAIMRNPPNMTILDIGLPDLDGWEVLRRLRAEPRTRDLPVLVLTGMTEASAEKAAALGANEFLTKPVSTTVLARLVGDLLARARTAGPALEQQAPIDD